MRSHPVRLVVAAALLGLSAAAPAAADSVRIQWDVTVPLLPVDTTGVDVEVAWGDHRLSDDTLTGGGLGAAHLGLHAGASIERPTVTTETCDGTPGADIQFSGAQGDAYVLAGARDAEGHNTVRALDTAVGSGTGGGTVSSPCEDSTEPSDDPGAPTQPRRGAACGPSDDAGRGRGSGQGRCDEPHPGDAPGTNAGREGD